MTTKITEKINKLLAMSDDNGASETERETAMRQAYKMMDLHNVSMADLEEEEFRAIKGEAVITEYPRKAEKWRDHIHNAVATMTDCYLIYDPRNKVYIVSGTEENQAIWRLMTDYLLNSIVTEAKASYQHAKIDGLDLSSPRTWNVSFGVGAAQEVYKRVNQYVVERDKRLIESKGTALVAVERSIELANEARQLMNETHCTRRTRTGTSVNSKAAYEQGQATGKALNMSLPSAARQITSR